MSIKRRRVSEMLKRVDQFGSTHTDAFPPRSTGRRLFSALQRALAELTTQQVAHISRHNQAGKSAADDAREKLLTRLRALCRTARSLAVGAPVADVTFRLPRRGGDHALIAAARQMTDAARPSNGRFAAYGLRLDDLDRAIAAFDHAVVNRLEHRRARVTTRGDLESALARAFSIVRRLDAVVTNTLADDVPGLQAWHRARRVVRRRRRK